MCLLFGLRARLLRGRLHRLIIYTLYEGTSAYLLPQSTREWLPEGHLALFLGETVSFLDLSAILERYRRGRGLQAYHPQMLLTLLLYGYCTGVYSSRKIAKGC